MSTHDRLPRLATLICCLNDVRANGFGGEQAMSDRTAKLRQQVLDTGKWAVCLPALAFWPFVSILPAFSLVGETRLAVLVPNAVFLLTGFWTILVAVVVYCSVISSMKAADLPIRQRLTGLSMAAYATLWMAAYGAYKLL
jgi:hypothetical protein